MSYTTEPGHSIDICKECTGCDPRENANNPYCKTLPKIDVVGGFDVTYTWSSIRKGPKCDGFVKREVCGEEPPCKP